jgi:zinc protease
MMKVKLQLFHWLVVVILVSGSVSALSALESKPPRGKKNSFNKETESSEKPEAAPASTQIQAPQLPADPLLIPLPLDPNVRFGILDNGMTYYVRKNTRPENRMELRLAVNAGSNQEDDDQLGLAHFLEHMAFNGTENFKKNDLINYVESIGTRFGPHLNAYTSFDETVYMLQVPTDDDNIIDKGLLIMRDWATGLSFDPEEIDKERGVVISEWRSSLGPQQRMQNQYFPVLFHQSRYAKRLPIGDTAILARAPYAAIERFYRDWYRPEMMAIIVVGDIDPDKMVNIIKYRFNDIKRVPQPRKKEIYPVPEHQETLVSIVTDKEAPYAQVIIFNKNEAVDPNSIKAYREGVMQKIINGMLNQRFQDILQKPGAPFFAAFSSYGNQVRSLDAFYNVAVTQGQNAEAALRVVLEETERAARFGFTEGELDREKADLLNAYEKALKEIDKTESSDYAMEYVFHYLQNQPSPGIEMEYQIIQLLLQTIGKEEINTMVKSWVKDENTVIVIAAPEKDKAVLPDKDKVLSIRAEVRALELDPYIDIAVADDLLPQTPKAGKITSKEYNAPYNLYTFTLSNGAKVIVKPTDFKNDEILFSAFSQGGNSLYSEDVFYSLSNADALVIEAGVGHFDKSALSKALAGKTVAVSPYISEFEEGLRGSCSPKDLETMLKLAHLYMSAPRKDTAVYHSYLSKQKALFTNLFANPQFYFQKRILEMLYQKNIRRAFPTAEDFDKIDYNTALDLYRERFSNAGDFNFLLIGNIDPELLAPLLETYIASLPDDGRRESWKDSGVRMPSGRVNKRFEMGTAPKTNVFMAMHGPAEYSALENHLVESLNNVLSIKLRESMREDKGGVYGVGVNGGISRRPIPEFSFTINFNAEPEKAFELMETASAVIQELMSNGPDELTLNKVKETQKRERETALKQNNFWASVIKESVIYGEPLNDLEKFNTRVEALNISVIREAAQKYLQGNNSILVVMSPEE